VNRIYWDADKGRFTDKTSNDIMMASYHNGWKLPQ